jgi:four helix bundle protein
MSTSQQVQRPASTYGRFHGDLPERTYRFAVSVVQLFEQIPSSPKAWVIARQLLRSGTSVGANVHEASQALTDAEFVQRCSIARKEAAETEYWLRLCVDAGLLTNDVAEPVRHEAVEILRILSSIVRRCQVKTQQLKRQKPVHAAQENE